MLEISHVTKQYGKKKAVCDLSLSLECGHVVALLGPNGSGKTTLMKMVAGLTRPTSGSITLEGTPIGPVTKRDVAYMPTEGFFYSYMTVMDAARFYQDFFADFDMGRFLSLLEADHLTPDTKIRAMSSGMMAKLKISLTFARRSKLIMLDEPLNGIDLIAREHTIRLIGENRGADRTMIVSSHLVEELKDIVDMAVFIKDGELVLFGDTKRIESEQGADIVEMYRRIYGEEAPVHG